MSKLAPDAALTNTNSMEHQTDVAEASICPEDEDDEDDEEEDWMKVGIPAKNLNESMHA